MSNQHQQKTTVLVFAGHDPSGGAGITADVAAIHANGAHAITLITAHTVQDTVRVQRFIPADPLLLEEQAHVLLADIDVSAIKIGMVGITAIVEAIHSVLCEYPTIPVIFDPVMAGGGGGLLMDDEVSEAMIELLLPRSLLLTPNSIEARRLAQTDELEVCGQRLLELGCRAVLIKGAHEATPVIVHHLYRDGQAPQHLSYPRLPQAYRGTGCTLASAIATHIAHGEPIVNAVQLAQQYTYRTLQQAYAVGHGQLIPQRFIQPE
jgi:hydroxymethylpyrimidine/phosphomethylpyrimidine kinase